MENISIPNDQLDVIFYHGAYPLWKYLQDVLEIDIVDVCARVTKKEPVLSTPNGDELVARVVSAPTEKLDPTFNNDVIFLLNSINVVFHTLQLGVERDDEKLLKKYKFNLDQETNQIRLVHTETGEALSEKRIAIIVKSDEK